MPVKAIHLSGEQADSLSAAIDLSGGSLSISRAILKMRKDGHRNPANVASALSRAILRRSIAVSQAKILFLALGEDARKCLGENHPFHGFASSSPPPAATSSVDYQWHAEALKSVERYNKALSKAIAFQADQITCHASIETDWRSLEEKRVTLFNAAFRMVSHEGQTRVFQGLESFMRARQWDRSWSLKHAYISSHSSEDDPDVHALIERETLGVFDEYKSALGQFTLRDIGSSSLSSISLKGMIDSIIDKLIAEERKRVGPNVDSELTFARIKDGVLSMHIHYLFNSSSLGLGSIAYFAGCNASPFDPSAPNLSRGSETSTSAFAVRFRLKKKPNGQYLIQRINWFDT